MKNYLLICLSFFLLGVISSQAKSVAVTTKVDGNAFYMYSGKTKTIKRGTILPVGSEIFTEIGAKVTLNDYYNHVFHLSGSGHIVLTKNLVELKSGYLWVQSLRENKRIGPMRVITANAEIEFNVGEGIINFDGLKSRSQLLAVKGDFILRNSTKDFSEVDVSEGRFSYISTSVDEGKPRLPTPVGYKSYQKLTGLFPEVQPLDGRGHADAPIVKRGERKIASYDGAQSNFEKALEAKKMSKTISRGGEVIFIRSRNKNQLKKEARTRGRLIASYQRKFQKKKKRKTKKRSLYSHKSPVKVKIFGSGVHFPQKVAVKMKAVMAPKPAKMIRKKHIVTHVEPVRVPRAPIVPKPARRVMASKRETAFESHLKKTYREEKKHKSELNGLIDELKSVDIDYQKGY